MLTIIPYAHHCPNAVPKVRSSGDGILTGTMTERIAGGYILWQLFARASLTTSLTNSLLYTIDSTNVITGIHVSMNSSQRCLHEVDIIVLADAILA